ncbi:MAG: cobalamin B12-binding domain-containing protein [Solirubrobacteraceae bacterium]
MNDEKPIKVLLAKKRIDVHGRGSKLIARELRDAGMEVVYFRFGVVPEIVEAAVQEDVDVVALSIMTSGQIQIAEELIPALKEAGLGEVPVIMGGTIPEIDFEPLQTLGVARVFLPGIPGSSVADYIRQRVGDRAVSHR